MPEISIEFARILAGLVLAPVFYFAVGLPWALATRRLAWAPLWGIGVAGLAAELACMMGIPAALPVLAVAALHVVAGGIFLGRRPAGWTGVRAAVVNFFPPYVLALIPLVAVPFSLPGGWGGDWAMALGAGEKILQAASFTPELLARPPLFGAASIPLLLLGPRMESFQIFCAVASACALAVFWTALPRKTDWRILWILAGSIFFLQITANAWAKFLSAAFLLAAWQAMAPAGGRRDRVAAGFLLGLALATHQSAVLFVPLILVRGWRPAEEWGQRFGTACGIGVLAALVVLPWELHTITAYGWEAKWLANPAVSQRLVAMPAWLNALLVGVTTFVAWGPFEIIGHWLAVADRFTLSRIAHEVYWFSTDAFNSLAGSLLGLVLPWWLALGTREFWRRVAAAWQRVNRPMRAALGLALAGQMLLNPFYSADGSLQTGWVPLGLAVALWFAGELTAGTAALASRVGQFTLWFAAAPWLFFHLALTSALVLSPAFRGTFVDTDLDRLAENHWQSLAMAGFPWIQVLLGAAAVTLWLRRSQFAAASAPADHSLNPVALT